MRVVVDTNIFVSSFFGGNPRKVLDCWFSGLLTLCVSRPVLKEYFDVLARFEFENVSLLAKLLSAIEKSNNILFVENPKEEKWIPEDPSDNKFIACAAVLNAQYLISGDAHLIQKRKIGRIEILTPSEMLKLLQ